MSKVSYSDSHIFRCICGLEVPQKDWADLAEFNDIIMTHMKECEKFIEHYATADGVFKRVHK